MKAHLLAVALSAVLSPFSSAADELRHLVFFKFKPEAAPESIVEIEKAFAELPGKIETIVDFEWGKSKGGDLPQGFTHCFALTFKDQAGLDFYAPHEAHKAFMKKLDAVVEKVMVFDYVAKEK